MIFHCVEKGCPREVSEGDLLFCRIHRDSWRDMCSNPFDDISENLHKIEIIMGVRLAQLK